MTILRRLGYAAVGCGLVKYAKCKDLGYGDSLKLKPTGTPGPRVAIIGAGVGGASCAHYLREMFKDSVTIDIYEKETVGGRAKVVKVGGHDFEAGASIIHGRNQCLVKFAKKFGLEKKKSADRVFGLSDGKDIYFTGSDDGFMTSVKMLWRYGIDMLKALYFVYGMLEKFKNIYHIQDQGQAFTSTQDLLHATDIDFVCMTHYNMRGLLNSLGFGDRFTEEIVMAAVHNNYGQNITEIHGFAGFVALAGITSNLWSVKGGNYLIPQHLIKDSKANLIKAEVKEVKLLENGQYELSYDRLKPKYDIVVLAAPQTERNQLKMTNFGRDLKSPYQRICTHFIQGVVNEDYFNYDKSSIFPTEMTITNPKSYFNTLAVNIPVEGSEEKISPKDLNVWKIFAKRPITEEEFKQLFTRIDSKLYVDWLAYPHFSAREHLPSFKVHSNFYYVNAIERAASAMEMSVIGGRNVAILAYNEWCGHTEKIDNKVVLYKGNKGSRMIQQPRLQ